MLQHYIKTAQRSLLKNKAYTLINVAGLSLGMCACLLILQYVSYELSFDNFHQNRANIYRIRNDRQAPGEPVQKTVATYPFVGPGLKKNFPEVQDFVRIAPWMADHSVITYGDKVFREKGFYFAEASFFKIFSFPLLQGDPANALKEPMSIVLSESKAKQIFGNENPIGKIVLFEAKKPFKVTGVFKDMPANSHLRFNMLASYETLVSWMDGYKDSKTFEETYTYLLLNPNTNIERFNLKLQNFSKKHYQGTKVTGLNESFVLQPFSNIHLHSNFSDEISINGSAVAVWGLFAVAVLIIVIAWCNYINLSASHYTKRIKEIGVKKIFGVSKMQFLKQFLVESILLCSISFLFAVLFFYIVKPHFSALFNLREDAAGVGNFHFISWIGAIAVFLMGAIISGIYPALILPSLKLNAILRGKINASPSFVLFNKSLVVFQFVITIALISFTLVAAKQLKFMTGKDLGVDIDGTLVVWGPMGVEWEGLESKMSAFQNEVKQLPGVRAATSSKNVPGDQLEKIYDVKLKGSNKAHSLATTWVNDSFFEVYDMKVLSGSKFHSTKPQIQEVMINEAGARLFGFSNNQGAIRKRLTIWGDEVEVVGVINNHHQQSMHKLVEPMLFRNGAGQDGYFSIKVSNRNIKHTLDQIKTLYSNYFKETSFEYFFLEESFEKQYLQDRLVNKVLSFFSMFAIFISCLGLLGLIMHAVAVRVKEIGIRKVLGASVSSILLLLSKDFLKLIALALLVATPVAWWIIHLWLNNFAYKTDVNLWPFVAAGTLTVFVSGITLSYQAFKAANENPVRSLRAE